MGREAERVLGREWGRESLGGEARCRAVAVAGWHASWQHASGDWNLEAVPGRARAGTLKLAL